MVILVLASVVSNMDALYQGGQAYLQPDLDDVERGNDEA